MPATKLKLMVQVRRMTEADIPGVVALQKRAFPKMSPWTPNQLKRHMATFPEGQLVALDRAGRVVGSASSLVVRWDDYEDHAGWNEITGRGSFRTHDPEGDTLYGADVGVDPEARGMGVGAALYEERRAIARRFGLARIVAGGRIPGYREVAGALTPEEYVAEVVAGRRKDTVLGFQLAQGFRVRGVIPRYLPSDHASKGFATLLEWENPAYHAVKPAA
jgi:ribosomal protein S18 acetylase RimI-like enzyme